MPQKRSAERSDSKPASRSVPRVGSGGATGKQASPSNRMARFRFAFEDEIPDEIWRQIDRLPTRLHRELLITSLSQGILPVHDEQAAGDKFVVYLDGDTPKHFGRLEGNKVMSKWGRGRVLNHGLWEVPLTYGSKVKYSSGEIDCATLKKVIEGFRDYARTSAKKK